MTTHLLALLFSLLPPAAPAYQAPAVSPIVSQDWLMSRLSDPNVRIIMVGDRNAFARGHIPGARPLSHNDTLGADGHRLAEPTVLAKALAAAGASDTSHVVLYGNSAMETGWIFMAFASIGHADRVSILDGNLAAWSDRKYPVSTENAAPPPPQPLTVRPAPDVIVAAPWVRERLENASFRVLDVRTERERAQGYVPGSTLILWQDLYADVPKLKFKSRDEIRALLNKAGLTPQQTVVTYCAVGMRASLMYFAARYAGVPARAYLGSWADWQNQPGYPIAR